MSIANESCSDMDNNELDYNENDSENGDENSKNFNLIIWLDIEIDGELKNLIINMVKL